MPVTFWTFIAGTLALAGVWPFSGFFSKDTILVQALQVHNYGLFALGWLVAALTAFYMLRLVLVVFGGPAKANLVQHAQESPPVMLWPLRSLALFSVIGGWIGLEALYARQYGVNDSSGSNSFVQRLFLPFTESWPAAVAGLLAAVLGFAFAYRLYRNATTDPLPERLGALSRAMRHRFYLDEFYEVTVIRAHEFLSEVAAWFDRWIIAGAAVRGTHGTTELLGRALRLLQTGNIQTYAFLFALGVAVVLYLALK